jgi:SPP1 gp7 family putative phage head morphogenesis protein
MISANIEASSFIRSKPALTKAAFNRLLPEIKAHAFTIAGVECLRIQQSIRDEIASIPEGALWEDVKASVVAQLDPYFVDPAADAETREKQTRAANRRAELLIRTHTSMAYAQTAYAVADEQRDLFPFWQYQTLGDGAVRPSHAALDGVVLPHDHPFWQTHTPPWDWGCRCQFIPLSDADVEELRAQDKALPEEKKRVLDAAALEKLEKENVIWRTANLANGTGHPVPYNVQSPAEAGKPGAFTWKPGTMKPDVAQLRAAHPDAFDDFEKWAKTQPLPEQGKTVWEWLVGEVAEPAPASVTVPEKAKSFAELEPVLKAASTKHRAIVTKAKAAEVEAAAAWQAAIKALTAEERLLRYYGKYTGPKHPEEEAWEKAVKELRDAAEASRAELHTALEIPAANRATVEIKKDAPGDNHDQGMKFIQRMTSKDVFEGAQVGVKKIASRANADAHGEFINGKAMSVRTVVHELGHIIEARRPDIMAKSLAFRASRTAGEKPKWLGKGHKKHEVALEDEWEKRGGRMYAGRVYRLPLQIMHNGKPLGPGDFATEILSMGAERLYTDPAGFILDDPDFASFVINTLRGL